MEFTDEHIAGLLLLMADMRVQIAKDDEMIKALREENNSLILQLADSNTTTEETNG